MRVVRGIGLKIAVIAGMLALAGAEPGRADTAVLRNGQRLKITGHQKMGETVRLTVTGGRIEISATEIEAIEPETEFPPLVRRALDVPFAELIRAAAERHGVDEVLLASVIATESNFNARAVSRKGASGLMQLMPETAARFGVRDIFDPRENIEAGTQYLKELLGRYEGDLARVLAAYNAGPERVAQHGGVPPYRETRNYVKKVAAKMKEAVKKD